MLGRHRCKICSTFVRSSGTAPYISVRPCHKKCFTLGAGGDHTRITRNIAATHFWFAMTRYILDGARIFHVFYGAGCNVHVSIYVTVIGICRWRHHGSHHAGKFYTGGHMMLRWAKFFFKAPFPRRPHWILMAIPDQETRLHMGAYTLFYKKVDLDRPPHPHRIKSQWSYGLL